LGIQTGKQIGQQFFNLKLNVQIKTIIKERTYDNYVDL
jgi:hypothetical protein